MENRNINTIIGIDNATSDKDKAQIINKFFSTIGLNLSEKIDSSDCIPIKSPEMVTNFILKEMTMIELHAVFKDM